MYSSSSSSSSEIRVPEGTMLLLQQLLKQHAKLHCTTHNL
jgi:hypothetical protein